MPTGQGERNVREEWEEAERREEGLLMEEGTS